MGDVEVTEIGENFELTFSEPKEYSMQDGEIFHKIYINKVNENGEEMSLIFSLRKYYFRSFLCKYLPKIRK